MTGKQVILEVGHLLQENDSNLYLSTLSEPSRITYQTGPRLKFHCNNVADLAYLRVVAKSKYAMIGHWIE